MSPGVIRTDFDLSSSDPFTISTRDGSDEVPGNVSKFEVVSFSVENSSGTTSTFQLEERDNDGNSTLRTFTVTVADADSEQVGVDDDRAIFEVNQGHQLRVTGDGSSEGAVEYREVK